MENKPDRNLTERCQYLVWTKDDAVKLDKILKNAPVRLSEEFGDEIIHVAFFYALDMSILKALRTTPFGNLVQKPKKLADREFDAVIEYNVDATQWMERTYEDSCKHDCCWLKNIDGKSAIGLSHLEILADKAQDIEVAESNNESAVFVGYRQNDKNYLIYFQLAFEHFPYVDG